jgi:CheY-like chemotaxis protein/anti-sigma regulatory factor (Ser/Thr protein kinase)
MPRILVVDDDPIDRELARRSLRGLAEAEFSEASEGRQALALASRERPDVMLTDLRMPGMDGLALVEAMQEEHPLVPVILMTSSGSERLAAQALRAGAVSYVVKTDLKNDLLDVVQRVWTAARARRHRAEALRFLDRTEVRFQLGNDPDMIPAVAEFLVEGLARIGFGDARARTQIEIALMETLSNAMIHGNLELGSDLRRSDPKAFKSAIEERRGREPYASRTISVRAEESLARARYEIEDQGPGFDVRRLPDPTDEQNLLRVGGRGVLLMRTFMDSVEYNETGNRVVLTKSAGAEVVAEREGA